jgi:hypothetical protein
MIALGVTCLRCWLLLSFSVAMVTTITVDDDSAVDAGACSLPLSREAASIIGVHMNAALQQLQQPFQLLPSCPILSSPSRFSLLASRGGQVVNRDGSLTCGECDDQFDSAREMDFHLIKRHPHLIHPDLHCLSSACDVLGCPSLPDVSVCTANSIAVIHRRCLHIMHQCFDGDSTAARFMFTEMSRRICSPLRCVDGHRALPELEQTMTSSMSSLAYWFKFVLVSGFVIAFYAFFWLYRREATIQDDLTRLAVKRRHMQAKLFEKEKLKGY